MLIYRISGLSESAEEFPTTKIEQYLHDCCSIVTDICRGFSTSVERYNIIDILPSDNIIQKYMSRCRI